MTKRERLAEVVDHLQEFRFCGPSDDSDEQTAVTTGYQYLVIQLQRLAAPLLPKPERERLNAIAVDVHDIYSAYEAHAEVDALLPDIEAALEAGGELPPLVELGIRIVEPELVGRLEEAQSATLDLKLLARLCHEINSCFGSGNLVASLLLMRTVLNYVPPIFGRKSFVEVAANSGRSLRGSFDQLEKGLRKVADFHAHRTLGFRDLYPSRAQIEPFKPHFELLLHEVLAHAEAG